MNVIFSTTAYDENGHQYYQLRVESDHKQYKVIRHSVHESFDQFPQCSLHIFSSKSQCICVCPIHLSFDSVKLHYANHDYVESKFLICVESRIEWKKFIKEHRGRGASIIAGFVHIDYSTVRVLHTINNESTLVQAYTYQFPIGYRTTTRKKTNSQQIPQQMNVLNQTTISQSTDSVENQLSHNQSSRNLHTETSQLSPTILEESNQEISETSPNIIEQENHFFWNISHESIDNWDDATWDRVLNSNLNFDSINN